MKLYDFGLIALIAIVGWLFISHIDPLFHVDEKDVETICEKAQKCKEEGYSHGPYK